MSDTAITEQKVAPQPPLAPLQATPAHVTGTAAGLAAAAAVLINAAFSSYSGHDVSVGVMGAETTLFTYLLGTWLHVPTS